jgi:hypothetical protein
MRRFAAIVLLVVCPAAAGAQSSTTRAATDQPQLPVSLDHIREGVLRDKKLNIPFLDPDTPVFRTYVEGEHLKLEDYWKMNDTAVGSYVRGPYASNFHQEFMMMVTPRDAMSASTSPFGYFGNPVYPIGIPAQLFGSIAGSIKDAFRERERARIRQQIQDELKQIEANRATSVPER